MKKIAFAALIGLIVANQVSAAEQAQSGVDAYRNSVLQTSAASLDVDTCAAPVPDDMLKYVTLKGNSCISSDGGYKVTLPKNALLTAAGSSWFLIRMSDARVSADNSTVCLALSQDEVEQLLGHEPVDLQSNDDDAPFTTAEFDAAVSHLHLLERSGLSMNKLCYDLFKAETYRRLGACSDVALENAQPSEPNTEDKSKNNSSSVLPAPLRKFLTAIRVSDEFSISVQRYGSHNFVLLRTNVAPPQNATAPAEAVEKFSAEENHKQMQIANVKEYILTMALTSQADKLFLFCTYAPDYPDESARLQEQYSVFKLKKMKKEYEAELALAKGQRNIAMQALLSSLEVR